jgi:flavin-dependent dehydrogenase
MSAIPPGDDVVVVGGGPAGALSALLLARRGWRVRLFDRDRFPRTKLCGDTLNPGALALLARHLDVVSLRALGWPIRGMRLSGPGGVAVCGTYPDGVAGLNVTRADFDHWLVREASRAGVAVIEDAPVEGVVVTGGRVTGVRVTSSSGAPVAHRATVVIGADGRRSRLAAGLGLARVPARPRRWAIGAYAEGVADVRADYGEMHVRAGRYLGIAPVPSGLTNVCLVVPYEAARGAVADAGAAMLAAAREDRWTAWRFADARLASPPVVLGPMAVDVAAPGVAGLLLAGDAAGFIDPMTGDGVRLALAGAEITAEVADAILSGAIDAAAAPALLARRRRAAFAGKWRFNRAVRGLVGGGALGGAAVLARVWPRMFEALICYAGDVTAAARPPLEAACPSR